MYGGPTVIRWDAANGASALMSFDAVESEAPEHAIVVTEYPIEMGANLVDHIRPKPVQLKLTVYVSNSPAVSERASLTVEGKPYPRLTHLDGAASTDRTTILVRQLTGQSTPNDAAIQVRQSFGSLAGVAIERTVPGLVSHSVPAEDNVPVDAQVRSWSTQKIYRAQAVFAELKRVMYEARECTIVSSLYGSYDRMLLKSIGTTREPTTGNAMRMELEFQQVAYAYLERREIAHLLPKKPVKPKSEPKKEDAPTPTPPDPKSEDQATSLQKIFGAVKGAGGGLAALGKAIDSILPGL